MGDIKYTNDGKKVLVVGKLNAEQTIVQEIFVSAGQEIPSGENFVVKSLHDQPAESWKEKNLRELEQRYEKDKKSLQAEIDQQRARLSSAKGKAKLHADALFGFVDSSSDHQLHLLKAFVSGQVTHIFVGGHSPEIIDWQEGRKGFDIDNYNGRSELKGIKLVSLFGYSEGNLEYRLHSYRDGSGGSEIVHPATSYAEALSMAQAELDEQASKFVSGESGSFYLNYWQKIDGVFIPGEAIEKCKALEDAGRIRRIQSLRDELAKLEAHE